MFEFERIGDVVSCKGDGFEYQRIGELTSFKQSKKLPSLRVIKSLIKHLEFDSDRYWLDADKINPLLNDWDFKAVMNGKKFNHAVVEVNCKLKVVRFHKRSTKVSVSTASMKVEEVSPKSFKIYSKGKFILGW